MSPEDIASTLDATKSRWATKVLDAPLEQRQQLMAAYLRNLVSQVLDRPPDEVPVDQGFLDLGLDSLMLMDMVGTITQDFQMPLYPRELFDSPTIETLARYLDAEIRRVEGVHPAAPPTSARPMANVLSPPKERVSAEPSQRIPGIAFLLSSPRAGSTLLRVMLAGHPKLFCPPELHLLPFSTMHQRREQLKASYLGEGLDRALMEVKGLDAEGATSFVNTLAEEGVAIQDIYKLLQKAAGGRLLVDKSPSYGASIETLQRAEALFEGSKYVHLVRHPYATIESIIRRRIDRLVGAEDMPPDVFAESLWANTNRNIALFLREIEPSRRLQVRYEDLVTAPHRVMNELCDFLGVPFDAATLKPYEGNRMTDGLHEKSLGIGDPNFLNHDAIVPALGEVWREKRLWRRLGSSAREVASELEYELPGQGPVVPPQPDTVEAFEEGRL